MNQFRWIDPTQPGRLVQGTQMLYISAFFDVFNAVIIGSAFSLIFFLLGVAKAFGGWGIANEKKLGYYAGSGAACATVLLDLVLLGNSPVFGLISLGIAVWIVARLVGLEQQGHGDAEGRVRPLGAGDGLEHQVDGDSLLDEVQRGRDVREHARLHRDVEAQTELVEQVQQTCRGLGGVGGGVDAQSSALDLAGRASYKDHAGRHRLRSQCRPRLVDSSEGSTH